MSKNDEPAVPPNSRFEVLLAQYRLLEERRRAFGREFMLTLSFFGAVLGIVIGLLGRENDPLLIAVLRAAGVAMLLLAYLAHRLGKRQDDCECELKRLEAIFKDELHSDVGRLPPSGAILGARRVIVTALVLAGLALLVFTDRFAFLT